MLYISSVLCLLYLGGKGYLEGTSFLGQTLTSGMIVSFYMYISKFFNPIQNLAEQFNWLQSAFASAEKVFSILDLEPKMQDAPDAIELTDIRGEIEFRDVWFSYIPGEWVLKGVSFHVNPKETIAFVGSTGSGKSTILKLLMRFWDVQTGRVSVDGADVREIPMKHLRDMESYVTQETHLFHDSIANNIAIAKPGATREEIMEAAKKASIHDFIMTLPNGYDTEVGELGDTLSGGEKQRIGIARAFLHDASMILLDEPTSNLDSLNEGIILKSLKESAEEKTIVLVSHRVSTMNVADVVYEMENGRIS